MKKILIATFSEVSYDSRVLRYLSSSSSEHLVILAGCGSKPSLNAVFEYIDLGYKGKRKNKNILDFLLYNIALKIKLYQVIKKYSPDIIHANDFETLIPSYCAFICKKSKIIYDSHEIWTKRSGTEKNLVNRLINCIDEIMEGFVVRKLANVITVSSGISKYLSERYRIKRPIVIMNMPESTVGEIKIPDEILSFFESVKEKIKLVYIGPVSRERNMDVFIDSFTKANIPNLHLILLGDSFLDKSYFNKNNITLFNKVPEQMLYPILSKCDIGVHPMRTDECLNHRYALPNKVFQYMQAGLALFVFKNDETDEILKKYKIGINLDFSSEEVISEKLTIFVKNDLSEIKFNSASAFKEILETSAPSVIYKRILNRIR
ncbi:MAG: glycosyltransferase [bacterium]